MAKGNDGNYLQHCVEVEAAVRLLQFVPSRSLHVALTHGMEPFEKLEQPKAGVEVAIFYKALNDATQLFQKNEPRVVTAYRKAGAAKHRYPNSAELLRTIVGKERLTGGIAEVDTAKHKALVAAWPTSSLDIQRASWRTQLDPGGALGCPNNLEAPWLFSMDPMTYSEDGSKENNLNGSDFDLLKSTLACYIDSRQPGIACIFTYGMKAPKLSDAQNQFWTFIDKLAGQLGVGTGSYWVKHIGGNRNLAGVLFSDARLAAGFNPRGVNKGRHDKQHDTDGNSSKQQHRHKLKWSKK